MAKLKKTLPKNFDKLIIAKEWETLKKELSKCELNAYERGGVEHILFATGNEFGTHYLSTDMVKWIFEQNNYDFDDEFWQKLFEFYLGTKPLSTLELILDSKENLIRNKALPTTYGILSPEQMALLLKHRAKPQLDNEPYSKPLYSIVSKILAFRENEEFTPFILIQLVEGSEEIFTAIKTLVTHGADPKAPMIQQELERIKENFYQCYRDKRFYDPELHEKMEQFELKLYELMQFEPT